MTAYSIAGITDLGSVTDERSITEANLFVQGLPRSASSDTIVFDLFGVTRTFTLTGTFSAVENVTIPAFIAQVQALLNGQQSSRNFVSGTSDEGNIPVKIENFEYHKTSEEPAHIVYTLTLIHNNSNAN